MTQIKSARKLLDWCRRNRKTCLAIIVANQLLPENQWYRLFISSSSTRDSFHSIDIRKQRTSRVASRSYFRFWRGCCRGPVLVVFYLQPSTLCRINSRLPLLSSSAERADIYFSKCILRRVDLSRFVRCFDDTLLTINVCPNCRASLYIHIFFRGYFSQLVRSN